MKNKIPKWWYSGFQKNFLYGIYHFIKVWYASSANPLYTIKNKIKNIRSK